MTGWQDGFGDEPTVEEVLANYERRVQVIAREWQRPGVDAADLMQEGRIALWREAEKRPGDDLQGLASVVIRRAVAPAAEYQRWTGTADGTKGKARDPIRRLPASLDATVGDEDAMITLADTLALEAPNVLDGVELAYHRGEILQALNELPESHREYVWLKFWRGMTESEIAAETGRSKGNVNRTWHEVIRPRLADRLEHLVAA